MAEPDTITNVIEFLEKLRKSSEAVIKFEKKDKSKRVMHCTLDFSKIPQWDKPKTVDVVKILKNAHKNGILRVYDLEKRGWRSVNFRKTEWLETTDEETGESMRYKIKP